MEKKWVEKLLDGVRDMFIGQSDIDAWCMRLRKFLESIRKQARPQAKKAVLRASRPVHAQDAEEIILQNLLNEFDINHVRKSKSIVLSGGERRRLEIARTLATNPKYLLLDEPLTGIDPVSIEEIKIIIKKLKDRNIGVLITDHNVRETLSITDRSYLLFNGQILKSGTSEFLANDEEARRLYLGEKFKLD